MVLSVLTYAGLTSKENRNLVLGTVAAVVTMGSLAYVWSYGAKDLGSDIKEFIVKRFEDQSALPSITNCDPEKFNPVDCEKVSEGAKNAAQKIFEMARKIKG